MPASDDDWGQLTCSGSALVSTSVSGFYQGAVRLDLLVAVRLLGRDQATARTVVLALLGLSAGTVFLAVWRWLRQSLALPASLFLVRSLSLDAYPSQLINPSASAFPDVLTAAGLLGMDEAPLRREPSAG